MANNLADYAENKVLELLVGKTAFTTPVVSVALYTVSPGEATAGTEVTGGAYARKATVAADWAAAASGAIANAQDLVFPPASASWGVVVAVALLDAASNMLWYGPLSSTKTVDTGDTFKFAVGQLSMSLN